MSAGDFTLIGGGVVSVLATAIGLILSFNRFLLGDRTAMSALQTEINTLRAELSDERNARRQVAADTADRISELEHNYDDQRHVKHVTINELTKVQMLLGLVIALAEDCTCGALAKVTHLMARVNAGDFTPEGAPVPPAG